MGQKTNTNIFLLGVNKDKQWESKYNYSSPEESTLYTFQHLEVKKFVERFFKLNGLLIHNYKSQFSKKTLYVYISYLADDKSISIINKLQTVNLKPLKLKESNKIQKKKKNFYKKLKILAEYKRFTKTINLKYTYLNSKNIYIEQLLESLSIFTKKNYNITLIFQNLNKELNLFNKTKKKFIEKQRFLLRRYEWNVKQNSKNTFFETSFQILPILVTTKNSAKFLAEFVALNMTYMKAHTFFLKFLERLLTNFTKAPFSKISGIKIAIKGRFNRAQRAKNRLLIIGEVPLQTFDSNINYYQSVSYTPNGTFGIKVWICQTKLIN